MSAPKVGGVEALRDIVRIAKAASIGVTRNLEQRITSAEKAIEDVEYLISAMHSAEGLAVCCLAVDGYSRKELAEMARASKVIFTNALARIGGAA